MLDLHSILLPYQQRFVDDGHRCKLWLSARQIGKSFDCGYIAVKEALTSPQGKNGLSLCISTGARAASELLKKVAQMAEALHIIDPSITYSARQDCITFSSGQRVVSLPSGNPSGLRGYTADCIIIDESAYIERPEDVYAAIVPTLTRNKNAKLVLASTPAGMNSWFYDIYQKALEDPDWYVQTTTIEDAVRDGLKLDIQQLRKTISDPAVWDQEYMCKFASEYGAMIDESLLVFREAETKDTMPHWCGMDIGAQSDRTAIVDIVELPDKSIYVEDITVMHKASYEHQLQILKDKNAKLHYRAGFIDANGIGNPIGEFANKQVSARIKGFTWTGSNKTPAYEDVRAMIFDRKLVFAPHLEETIKADFRNVHRIVNEAGKVTYSAGRDANGHSDVTSALVLAIQALKSVPNQIQMPTAQAFRSLFNSPSMFG